MEKVALNKDVRIKRDENYVVLTNIENQIRNEVRKRFADETKVLREETDSFVKEEKEFHRKAQEMLRGLTPNDKLKVCTQVGKGSSVINEYVGYIEKNIKYSDTWFNFISDDRMNDGRPFTIGFSCLLSIEKL